MSQRAGKEFAVARRCVGEHQVMDAEGRLLRLARGKVYLTSQRARGGRLTVFTNPMLTAPKELFRRVGEGAW